MWIKRSTRSEAWGITVFPELEKRRKLSNRRGPRENPEKPVGSGISKSEEKTKLPGRHGQAGKC